MTKFILGDDWASITIGVLRNDESGKADMPYFGIAPSDAVTDDVDVDDQKKIREVFEEKGAVYYFDNMEVAHAFMSALSQTLSLAVETTDWASRKLREGMIQ